MIRGGESTDRERRYTSRPVSTFPRKNGPLNSVKRREKGKVERVDRHADTQIRAGDGSQTRALRRLDTNTLILLTTIQHDARREARRGSPARSDRRRSCGWEC